MTPIAIKYGGKYYVGNLYASAYAKELYLDTCGGAKSDPTSVYNVTTSSVPDRAGVGTGTWKILSAAIPPVKEGEVVKIGDLVYLANQYS